jgi:hypothetical protein
LRLCIASLPLPETPYLGVHETGSRPLFSKRHEWYWRNDARFAKILHPKRIRLAFADEIALKRWQSELKAIIDEGVAKPPMGSIDDGQEMGKTH